MIFEIGVTFSIIDRSFMWSFEVIAGLLLELARTWSSWLDMNRRKQMTEGLAQLADEGAVQVCFSPKTTSAFAI